VNPGEPDGLFGRLFAYSCNLLADLLEGKALAKEEHDVPERVGRTDRRPEA